VLLKPRERPTVANTSSHRSAKSSLGTRRRLSIIPISDAL